MKVKLMLASVVAFLCLNLENAMAEIKSENQENLDKTVNTEPERRKKPHRSYFDFHLDFGSNNFLENGVFPEENGSLYAVKPWGSWYVALNGEQVNHIGGPLHLKLGAFVDWYNFKFENTDTRILSGTNGINFFELNDPDINSSKSKLTAAYLNFKAVPSLFFGRNKCSHCDDFMDFSCESGVRIGVGGYVGYKLDSYTKVEYEQEEDKRRDRERTNYFTSNIRYGIRFELGISGLDFFLNYDLNSFFIENRGPELNALAIGITL